MTCMQRQIPLKTNAQHQSGDNDEFGYRNTDTGKKNDEGNKIAPAVYQQEHPTKDSRRNATVL